MELFACIHRIFICVSLDLFLFLAHNTSQRVCDISTCNSNLEKQRENKKTKNSEQIEEHGVDKGSNWRCNFDINVGFHNLNIKDCHNWDNSFPWPPTIFPCRSHNQHHPKLHLCPHHKLHWKNLRWCQLQPFNKSFFLHCRVEAWLIPFINGSEVPCTGIWWCCWHQNPSSSDAISLQGHAEGTFLEGGLAFWCCCWRAVDFHSQHGYLLCHV